MWTISGQKFCPAGLQASQVCINDCPAMPKWKWMFNISLVEKTVSEVIGSLQVFDWEIWHICTPLFNAA